MLSSNPKPIYKSRTTPKHGSMNKATTGSSELMQHSNISKFPVVLCLIVGTVACTLFTELTHVMLIFYMAVHLHVSSWDLLGRI
jgi:hypothetical protein